MGLKKLLDAGGSVIGSIFDGKIKPLGSLSEATQKRLGYTDKNGYWTERGWNRHTSADSIGLETSHDTMVNKEIF